MKLFFKYIILLIVLINCNLCMSMTLTESINCTRCLLAPPHPAENFRLDCGHTACANRLREIVILAQVSNDIFSARCFDAKCNRPITLENMRQLGLQPDVIQYFTTALAQLPADPSERARIDLTRQICPRCFHAMAKNNVSNHITCENCRHEFCWICRSDWQRCSTMITTLPDVGAGLCRAAGADRIAKDEEIERRRRGERPNPTALEEYAMRTMGITPVKLLKSPELKSLEKKNRIIEGAFVLLGLSVIALPIIIYKFNKKSEKDKKQDNKLDKTVIA